jgi:uncharacterized protein YndB with AHSA1/START domain
MVATTTKEQKSAMKTEIHVTRTYPHPRAKVWRAITEPALVEKWLMRPEGLAPVVGTKFKLVAKPQPGWRGFVECEVLEVVHGRRFVFSWLGDEKGPNMVVTFSLEDEDDGVGTRFTLDHTGFEGVSGWLLAKLMMGPGWKKMMTKRLGAVLAEQ